MYHSQLIVSPLISFAYVATVVICLFSDKSSKELSNIKRLIIFLIGIMITGLISTAIYIQCTAQFYSVKNPTIEGIQGRYFIPVILLLPLIINIKKKKISSKYIFSSVLVINLITLFYIISQFMI